MSDLVQHKARRKIRQSMLTKQHNSEETPASKQDMYALQTFLSVLWKHLLQRPNALGLTQTQANFLIRQFPFELHNAGAKKLEVQLSLAPHCTWRSTKYFRLGTNVIRFFFEKEPKV